MGIERSEAIEETRARPGDLSRAPVRTGTSETTMGRVETRKKMVRMMMMMIVPRAEHRADSGESEGGCKAEAQYETGCLDLENLAVCSARLACL